MKLGNMNKIINMGASSHVIILHHRISNRKQECKFPKLSKNKNSGLVENTYIS